MAKEGRAASAGFAVGLLLLLALAACTRSAVTVEEAIVGQWENKQGGTIYFYADNTGYIPGYQGPMEEIPETAFTYYFDDNTHLGMVIQGQPAILMEIRLAGDRMTWLTTDGGPQFVYTRVR